MTDWSRVRWWLRIVCLWRGHMYAPATGALLLMLRLWAPHESRVRCTRCGAGRREPRLSTEGA